MLACETHEQYDERRPHERMVMFMRVSPLAGAVGPALLRSKLLRIDGIASGQILPRPTSARVPAMIRTML